MLREQKKKLSKRVDKLVHQNGQLGDRLVKFSEANRSIIKQAEKDVSRLQDVQKKQSIKLSKLGQDKQQLQQEINALKHTTERDKRQDERATRYRKRKVFFLYRNRICSMHPHQLKRLHTDR